MPDIYINTDRPVDRSVVAGINQPQREAPIGAFVAGSSYDVNLYFVQNDGTYNALSGVGGTDVKVSISTISRPESGTFTLTDGTATTTALTYGASAQVVEDALNALNSSTGPNLGTVSLVDVVKANDTQYNITFRTFGAMTALSGGAVSLFPESTATGSIAVTGTATIYAQQVIELTRQPAIYQPTWSAITSGFNATVAVDTTRLLQSLVLEKGQPFYIEVKLAGEVVAREVVGMEHSTMPASAFTATAIATLLDAFAADPTTNTNFTASAWITALSTEGTDILSTGETGAVKYLREDGDGTSSWQTPPGTADQTGAEIKVAYEAEPDTNAFDDKSKIAAFTAQGTGLLDFDGFAINADTTKFDLGAGSGWIVDNTTNPLVPVVTEVSWVAATAITVTNLATANITYVAINSSGTVVQFTAPLDDNERRDNIFLGNIGHPDNATVTTAFSFPAVAAAPAAQVQDLIEAIGPFNRKGNLYSADSADLNLHRSAGEVFALGANYDNDPKKPHSRSTSAANPITSMLYVLQDGTNSAATAVDPDNYDLAAVLTAVPVNKFTVQRVFMFRGGFTNILYGQHVYGSMAAAREGAATDTTIVPQVVLDSAIAMCVIIIKEGATDLQDAGEVFIQNFSPFGGTAGGAQANGTLQGTYDNSSTPEIVTDSIRGALSVQRGSAADTDNIFEGQSGAGTITFEVTGEGDVDAAGDVTSTNTGANAPVSTAQQTAINLKADAADVDTGMLYEQYFTGQSGLSSIRAMLDADKSCGMVVIGDSTGDNPTTAWPRKFADIIATNYAGHRVVLQDVTQNATKDYVETVVQAGSNGDRYIEWRPETPTAWVTSTSYSVADWVGATHPSPAYICTVAHTAGGDDEEPGVGANWENYWEKSTHCGGIIWPSEDVDFFHGDNSTESTESFEILLDLYVPSGMSGTQTAFAKFTATAIERGARIDIAASGVPLLLWQADKTLSTLTTESPPSGGADRELPFDTRCLLRVRFDPDNGSSNRTIDFHYSTDSGASWTQMGGATETGAVTKWAKTPGYITLGAAGGSSTSGFWGLKVYQLTIREGIAGTGRVLGNPLVDTASWASNISNPILRGDPVFEIQNFSWSGKNTEDMAGNVALTGSTFIESSDFTPSNVVSAMINLGHNDNPNALNYFAGKNWTVGLKVISEFIQAQCPFATVGVIGQNPKNNGSEYDKQHALRIAYGLSEVPRNGDGFCNIYQAFLDFNKLALVTDGTHPNEEGYQFWADTLWQAAQIGH